jgi:hypothetical protein
MIVAVEGAIRRHLADGEILRTPCRRASFRVQRLCPEGIEVLIGPKLRQRTLKWAWLEGTAQFLYLNDRVSLNMCAQSVADRRESLCEYLRRHCLESTAGWLAALLERAGVVEISRPRPTTVRLTEQFKASYQLNGTRSLRPVEPVAARTHVDGLPLIQSPGRAAEDLALSL